VGEGMRIDGLSGRNRIINGNKTINQRGYTGGVLADGVYGYDRWKGVNSDANIEQVIEQSNMETGIYAISWVGGGTATVNGVSGLVSGDSLTVTVAGNVSVIVPKAATKIQLEKGAVATDFEYKSFGNELASCQRYAFNPKYLYNIENQIIGFVYTDTTTAGHAEFRFPVPMTTAPTLFFLGVSSTQSLYLGYPDLIQLTGVIAAERINTRIATYTFTTAGHTALRNYQLFIPDQTNGLIFSAEL